MKKQILATLSITIAVFAAFAVASNVSAVSPGAVFTIDNAAKNSVVAYTRGINGSLTWYGNFSTQGNGTRTNLGSQGAVMLTDDGSWLLVVNAASNDITVFKVNGANLTFVSKAASQGTMPISLTIHDYFVYVLNAGGKGNVAGFLLSTTGNLTYIPGSNQTLSGKPNASPEQIGFNSNGTLLVVSEKATDTIDVYAVDTYGVAGAPKVVNSTNSGPYGFAFTPQGYLIMSESANNTMTSYAASDNGNLRILSGAMPTFGSAPCWVALTNNSKYAYTTNARGGTISAFMIDASGRLQLFSSIAAKVSTPALDMDFTPDNAFLYVLNGNSITGFQVYNDGSLWQVTNTSRLPASTTGLAAT